VTQPTTGYTSDEIQTAVTALVQSTISRPIDTLGVLRTDISFNDFQQAAAGVFLLYPDAPYYVVALGASRALDLISAEEDILVELIAAVQAMGRQVLPVADVTTLFNAQAALQALQTAAAARDTAFANITSLPSYQQFTANVQSFLSGPGQTVVSGGQVVQTPQEAQTVIPGLVTSLQAAHTAVVTAVTQLAGAIDDFNSLNLPSVVASSVIGNAQALVGSSATTMSSLTPTQRLQQVRQVALNLLASQAVVTTFGSFSGPSEFISITGTGRAYSDATHPAYPAALDTDFGGAFVIILGTNDTLTSTLDGGAPSSITLAPSPLAVLTSSLTENNFVIGDGTQPVLGGGGIPYNNIFKIKVAGVTYVATLPNSAGSLPAVLTGTTDITPGGLYGGGGTLNGTTLIITVDSFQTWIVPISAPANPTALVAQINAVTHTGSPYDAIASFVTPNLVLTSANAGPGASLVIQGGTANSILGFTSGEMAAGTNQYTTAASIASAINGVLPAGVVASAVGGSPQKLQIACTMPSTQLAAGTTLEVFGDTVPSTNALITLGFSNGQTSSCSKSTADSVATDISSKVTNFTALAVFFPSNQGLAAVPAHTSATTPNLVTLARTGATGNTTFVTTTLTFTVTVIPQPGAVVAGDVIVLRTGPTLSYYTIQTVNGVAPAGNALNVGDVIVAISGAAGTPATGVSAEIGPPVPGTEFDSIDIETGVNSGTYYVQGLGVSPIDVLLQQNLPMSSPQTSMTVGYGDMYLEFSSKNTTTSSSISISGDGAPLFFATPPGDAVGSSQWFLLPSIPAALQTGDLLEYFGTFYNSPDDQYEIINIIAASNLIQLDEGFPDGITVNFSMTIPVPFGRLRTGKLQDFVVFQNNVNAWLAGVVNASNFFSKMNAAINPLLVNSTPTAVQVQTALAILNQLYGVLSVAGAAATNQSASGTIENTLTMYYTDTENVPQVDTLISSFVEKGSDKAVDVLLTGQFSVFFGLTEAGASYAGAFQSAAQSVAMNDLPVRKVNRSEVTAGRLLGQTSSADLEFPANSTSEQLQGEQVTPPGTSGQPANFGTTTGSSGAGGNA